MYYIPNFFKFSWKIHENQTENSKVTDLYIYIMMQIFLSKL